MIDLAEARLRGIPLPADDGAAQDIIDEQEAWLARRIGPLEGDRTETFYVGLASVTGKLGLRRYTDAVVVTDAGLAFTAFRLVDEGSAIVQVYSAASRIWRGPYVTATYAPNDADEVRKGLYDLIALACEPVGTLRSEQIGSYSYNRGEATPAAMRSAILSEILPKRDANYTLHTASRSILGRDPVINRAEPIA